jgi:hypothetical protein
MTTKVPGFNHTQFLLYGKSLFKLCFNLLPGSNTERIRRILLAKRSLCFIIAVLDLGRSLFHLRPMPLDDCDLCILFPQDEIVDLVK